MKYVYLIGGLALTLAVAGRAQTVQANCEERLDNNTYSCEITDDHGMLHHECLHFTSPGLIGDFDLEAEGLGAELGCSCETKNKNKFKQSNRFLCVGGDNENVSESNGAVTFGGKATSKGNKIKKGQIVFENGESAIYTCTLDPDCELEP